MKLEIHTLEDIVHQAALLKRGLLLEYLTLGWNIVGVIIVIFAAFAARSVALAGFGLDSLIEIFASVVVVWQLTGVNLPREHRSSAPHRERVHSPGHLHSRATRLHAFHRNARRYISERDCLACGHLRCYAVARLRQACYGTTVEE